MLEIWTYEVRSKDLMIEVTDNEVSSMVSTRNAISKPSLSNSVILSFGQFPRPGVGL